MSGDGVAIFLKRLSAQSSFGLKESVDERLEREGLGLILLFDVPLVNAFFTEVSQALCFLASLINGNSWEGAKGESGRRTLLPLDAFFELEDGSFGTHLEFETFDFGVLDGDSHAGIDEALELSFVEFECLKSHI